MFVLVLISVYGLTFGQVALPHGHDLKVLVDNGFGYLDHNPQDGVVDLNEWDAIVDRNDMDNDTCVTRTEYVSVIPGMSNAISDPMFTHFDHDKDGCLNLSDMQAEYHLIDHSHDNKVTKHEWEQYFTHLMTNLFGHGHGHNGK